MPEFEYSYVLYFLLLVPAFALIFILSRLWRRKLLSKFGNRDLLNSHIKSESGFKAYLKFILAMLGLIFLIITLANPRVGTKLNEAKREGIDIVIGLDISKSMTAEDVKPNRLERAKQSISNLLDKLETDRIGMIIFAGSANVLFPLTNDYSAAKLFLSTIDPEFISEQGTAIGEAISIASEKFKTNEKQKKALILITDGENHEDFAMTAASEAADKGFVIFTVGIGSLEGAPIPIYTNSNISGYLKDDDGKTVISKLNGDVLRELAEKGGGKFIRSFRTEPDLQDLINQIDKMEKKQFESKKFAQYDSKYQYFLLVSLFFFVLDALIMFRKGRILKALNFFGENEK